MTTRATTAWLALALVFGCKSEPEAPKFSEPMTLGGVSVPAEVLNRGARVYAMRCATCHGPTGAGDGPGARALKNKPRDFQAASFKWKSTPGDALPTDRDLSRTIRGGRLQEGMPAWPAMSEEDLHAVVQYLKTFSPRWQSAAPAPDSERASDPR